MFDPLPVIDGERTWFLRIDRLRGRPVVGIVVENELEDARVFDRECEGVGG